MKSSTLTRAEIQDEHPMQAGRYNTFCDLRKPSLDRVLFKAFPFKLFKPVNNFRSIRFDRYGHGWGAVT